MVKRERLIKKIEEKGYVLVDSGAAVFLFRKPGTMQFITVRRVDYIPDDAARLICNQLGEDADCIETFVANN